MNRQALALAADSAVTVTSSQGSRKAWPSASKIFGMPEPHSVAIMIYGSTSFHRLPWETVIKEFRTSLRRRPYQKLEGYTAAFLRFLRSTTSLAPADEQTVFVRAKIVMEYLDLRVDIETAIAEALQSSASGALSPAEQRKVITETIRHWADTLRARPRVKILPTGYQAKFKSTYGGQIKKAKEQVFQRLPLTSGQSRQLTTIGYLIFERVWPWESRSGIVIAGYGAQDLFPVLDHLQLEGFAADVLVMDREDTLRINRNMRASVRAFAQGDDVWAFMEGVLPAYQREIDDKLHNRIVELPLELIDKAALPAKNKSKIKADVNKAAHRVYESTLEELGEYRRRKFVGPVLNVVAALPIEDLAVMAETLVNLTSFRQKVSMSLETVGGPVDVALISKGDGFIWIKRKNYFQLDQNPRVLAKYFTRG